MWTVHGNGGKDTHNQANNERTAFHRTAPPPLLVRLLPNETEISHGRVSWQADNLSNVRWSWGCVTAVDPNGRTIWIVDAHRGDGNDLTLTVVP